VQDSRRILKQAYKACEYANPEAWAHPKMLTGTDDPHTRRTSGPISAIKHHGTPVERIAHRQSANHRVAVWRHSPENGSLSSVTNPRTSSALRLKHFSKPEYSLFTYRYWKVSVALFRISSVTNSFRYKTFVPLYSLSTAEKS
jgi:hypothetical protein